MLTQSEYLPTDFLNPVKYGRDRGNGNFLRIQRRARYLI